VWFVLKILAALNMCSVRATKLDTRCVWHASQIFVIISLVTHGVEFMTFLSAIDRHNECNGDRESLLMARIYSYFLNVRSVRVTSLVPHMTGMPAWS